VLLCTAGLAGGIDTNTVGVASAAGVLSYGLALALTRVGASPRQRRFGTMLAGGLAVGGLIACALAALGWVALGGRFSLPIAAGAVLFGATQAWLARVAAKAASELETNEPLRIAGTLAVGLASLLGLLLLTVPGMVRTPHPSNESSAIGDLRTFGSAEVAYQAASGGVFVTPSCLVRPHPCLTGSPQTTPPFLDVSFLQPARRGYRFEFHPGRPATTEQGGQGFSSFAYTATPEPPGTTGVRSFCIDDTGVLRGRDDGALASPLEGRCSPEVPILR
jgi:MFS family permease